MVPERLEKFCGQTVSAQQLTEIVEITETFPKLSRTELANPCQIGKEILFMREKLVKASIQFVLLDDLGIFAQQVRWHCCDTNGGVSAIRCPGKSGDRQPAF